MKPVDAVANYGTLHHMFFARAEDLGDAAMVLEGKSGQYKPVSWASMAAEVRQVASGLLSLGVQKGDRVAIMAYNRPQWLAADMAIMAVGARHAIRSSCSSFSSGTGSGLYDRALYRRLTRL